MSVCTGTIFHKTQAKKLPLAEDGNKFRNPEPDITERGTDFGTLGTK